MGIRLPTAQTLNSIIPGAGVIVIGLANTGSGQRWPLQPYTSDWWEVVALGLGLAVSGLARRHAAESALERV